MPILPPRLDDRSFDDLLEDLLNRIPAHTPEWTNPRLGDPGRTLLELFAWLGDALLYRVNLIPERQRLVFLKLLGQGLRPARPAGGIVSLAFAQASELAAVTLAAGARIKAPVPFETLAETTLLPVAAEAWYKQPLGDADAARMEAVIAGLQKVHRIDGAAKGYLATALFEGGQAASGEGVDVFAQSADRALWLALMGLATVGTIVTFMSYGRNFINPLRQLANMYNSIQAALAGAERVFEIIDSPTEVDAASAFALQGKLAGDGLQV